MYEDSAPELPANDSLWLFSTLWTLDSMLSLANSLDLSFCDIFGPFSGFNFLCHLWTILWIPGSMVFSLLYHTDIVLSLVHSLDPWIHAVLDHSLKSKTFCISCCLDPFLPKYNFSKCNSVNIFAWASLEFMNWSCTPQYLSWKILSVRAIFRVWRSGITFRFLHNFFSPTEQFPEALLSIFPNSSQRFLQFLHLLHR